MIPLGEGVGGGGRHGGDSCPSVASSCLGLDLHVIREPHPSCHQVQCHLCHNPSLAGQSRQQMNISPSDAKHAVLIVKVRSPVSMEQSQYIYKWRATEPLPVGIMDSGIPGKKLHSRSPPTLLMPDQTYDTVCYQHLRDAAWAVKQTSQYSSK